MVAVTPKAFEVTCSARVLRTLFATASSICAVSMLSFSISAAAGFTTTSRLSGSMAMPASSTIM